MKLNVVINNSIIMNYRCCYIKAKYLKAKNTFLKVTIANSY